MANGEDRNTPEGYARNWQVESLQRSIDDVKSSNKEESREIKDLIQGFIKEARVGFVTKKELDKELSLIDEKYGPMKKWLGWIAATLGGLIISYAFQLFINIQNQVDK